MDWEHWRVGKTRSGDDLGRITKRHEEGNGEFSLLPKSCRHRSDRGTVPLSPIWGKMHFTDIRKTDQNPVEGWISQNFTECCKTSLMVAYIHSLEFLGFKKLGHQLCLPKKKSSCGSEEIKELVVNIEDN